MHIPPTFPHRGRKHERQPVGWLASCPSFAWGILSRFTLGARVHGSRSVSRLTRGWHTRLMQAAYWESDRATLARLAIWRGELEGPADTYARRFGSESRFMGYAQLYTKGRRGQASALYRDPLSRPKAVRSRRRNYPNALSGNRCATSLSLMARNSRRYWSFLGLKLFADSRALSAPAKATTESMKFRENEPGSKVPDR